MRLKRADWLAIARDRTAIILLITAGVALFAVIITAILRIHYADVQIPVRYSAYGQTHIYRDHWYNLYMFPLFGSIIVLTNAFIAAKLIITRRYLALGLLSSTILLLVITLLVQNIIFNMLPTL